MPVDEVAAPLRDEIERLATELAAVIPRAHT
jgi:hypothetical protein